MSLLSEMKILYSRAFFPKGKPTPPSNATISTLNIVITTSAIPKSPQKGNETYTLITNSSGIFVSAYDTYGVSRALATLSQVITEQPSDAFKAGLYSVQSVSITDYPAL